LIYVSDSIFDLQVIQGPGTFQPDTDSDGIIDFFDAFPTDATETRDSDGDRLGDQADSDDDNDGFTDAEEAAATPPTSPTDPFAFPVLVPPAGVTTILVDAATSLTARQRQGTPEAPYRSVSEALRAVHSGQSPDVHTLRVRAGIYSPVTTQEVIPLDLGRLSHLTVQGEELGNAVLDGSFRGNVINAEFSENLVLERFVVTHGATGIRVRDSAHVTIRDNQIMNNNEDGIEISLNANTGIVVTDNLVEDNGNYGIHINRNAAATLRRNIVRLNANSGIQAISDSNAEMIGNVVENNTGFGISVAFGATPTLTENISAQNGRAGIVIFSNVIATVTRNIMRLNERNGIVVDVNSTAELRDNTIVGNGASGFFVGGLPASNGINVGGGSVASISGGTIAQNAAHGILVTRSLFSPEIGTAHVGIDSDAVLELTDNGGAGIFVSDDGSVAEIDSRNIVFRDNAEGDTVGNVIDVAPGP
jgi:parallel beta-helix repeat protein